MRVALLGGECTGKSTLARALGEAFKAPIATEALRDFVEAEGRVPRADEQSAILAAQRSREDSIADAPIVICDPATAMTAVYSSIYYADDSLVDLALAQARDYAVILWCRPDIPWCAEPGQHDGPARRVQADARIAELINGSGLPVTMINGDRDERLQFAISAVQSAVGQAPAWQPSGGAPAT